MDMASRIVCRSHHYATDLADRRGCKIGRRDQEIARRRTTLISSADMTEIYLFLSICLSSIGGAIFSAGAGGSAGLAPAFCAAGSGWAGCGAGVVGRVPPGFESAGLLLSECGEACSGCVACAMTCG